MPSWLCRLQLLPQRARPQFQLHSTKSVVLPFRLTSNASAKPAASGHGNSSTRNVFLPIGLYTCFRSCTRLSSLRSPHLRFRSRLSWNIWNLLSRREASTPNSRAEISHRQSSGLERRKRPYPNRLLPTRNKGKRPKKKAETNLAESLYILKSKKVEQTIPRSLVPVFRAPETEIAPRVVMLLRFKIKSSSRLHQVRHPDPESTRTMIAILQPHLLLTWPSLRLPNHSVMGLPRAS